MRRDDVIAWAIALTVFGGLTTVAVAGLLLVIGLLPLLALAFPLTLTAVVVVLVFALVRRKRRP